VFDAFDWLKQRLGLGLILLNSSLIEQAIVLLFGLILLSSLVQKLYPLVDLGGIVGELLLRDDYQKVGDNIGQRVLTSELMAPSINSRPFFRGQLQHCKIVHTSHKCIRGQHYRRESFEE
jgi:hypothetical protein